MKVRLNFAQAPFRNERLPALIFGFAASVLLGATILHGVVLTRYLLREQEELDAKVEALQKELSATEAGIQRAEDELRSQRNDVRTERIRFLANVYRHKGFSWTGLFNELESLTPAAVRITSIAPAGIASTTDDIEEEIQVELHVIARSLDDVLEMVRRLEAAQYLTTVLPQMVSDGEDTRDAEGWSAIITLQYLPHHKRGAEDETVADSIEDEDETAVEAPVDLAPADKDASENLSGGTAVPGDDAPVGTAVPGKNAPVGPAVPGKKKPENQ
jgi:Tfp pilus assembly protein PilN